MNQFETLTLERHGVVTELTLTRPEILNPFDDKLHVELTLALNSIGSNTEIRTIVLASTGKVFSAGGSFDLMMAARSDVHDRLRIIEDGRRLLMALMDIPQPIIVAMHGHAVGLAATVVLACDAVVAARDAYLTDPHVPMGLVAGDGGCLVWPQAAGMLRAKRYLLTGDRVQAEDAYRMGLVTDLVDAPTEALSAARALAERIAGLPPLAVQLTKRALNRVMQQRAGEVIDLGLSLEATTLASDDMVEAIAAFKERRLGQFHRR